MMSFLKKIPYFIMLLILSMIYLSCGYLIGYYNGYNQAQKECVETSEFIK